MKSRQIFNFMLELIVKNPGTTTSIMYLKYLLYSNMYHHGDTDNLELANVSLNQFKYRNILHAKLFELSNI